MQLDDDDLRELDTAIRGIQSTGRELADITPDTFVLPGLSVKRKAVLDRLLHGCGFTLIRGFPVSRYTLEQTAIAYLGIGAHLGSFRSQNAKGHLLGHVTDLGADIAKPTTRYYQTNRGLEFHGFVRHRRPDLPARVEERRREPNRQLGHLVQHDARAASAAVRATLQRVPDRSSRRDPPRARTPGSTYLCSTGTTAC